MPIPSDTQENPKFKACLSNSEFQVVPRVPRLKRKRGSPGECRSVVMLLPRLSKVLESILYTTEERKEMNVLSYQPKPESLHQQNTNHL